MTMAADDQGRWRTDFYKLDLLFRRPGCWMTHPHDKFWPWIITVLGVERKTIMIWELNFSVNESDQEAIEVVGSEWYILGRS